MFYERNVQPVLGLAAIALGCWFGWKKSYWLTLPAAVVCGTAGFAFAEFADTATPVRLAATVGVQALRGLCVGTLIGAFVRAVRSV